MKSAPERLIALEGLRGIAAIVVVFYHAFYIFWSYMMVGDTKGATQNMRFEDNVFSEPVFGLFSGTFAVAIFFVLSGFVLSIGFFKTGREDILKKLAAKRYLRLMLPALASVMLAWLLITLGLSSNAAVAEVTSSDWLARQWDLVPNFFEALRQGLWGTFVNKEISYNRVLWTMQIEFLGSFMVFAVAFLFGKSSKRGWVYAALILLTLHTWYIGFIIGMMLADLYTQKKFPFTGAKSVLPLGLLGLGFFLGGYPIITPAEGSVYSSMALPWLTAGQNLSLYTSLAAVCVLISVLTLPWLRALLSHRYISALGKYTFSLYLVHKLVLFTLTVGVFLWLLNFMSFNLAAVVSIMISLPVIASVAYLFEKYVDAPAIRVSNIFATWLLGIKKKPEETVNRATK